MKTEDNKLYYDAKRNVLATRLLNEYNIIFKNTRTSERRTIDFILKE